MSLPSSCPFHSIDRQQGQSRSSGTHRLTNCWCVSSRSICVQSLKPCIFSGSFPFLTHYPELALDHWAKRYGPLYSMWLGNQLFVVISSPNVAKDLLVTKGTVFSSRKDNFIKSQTILAAGAVTATPYNDKWSVRILPIFRRI